MDNNFVEYEVEEIKKACSNMGFIMQEVVV